FNDTSGNPATLVTPGYPLLILPFLAAKLDLRYLIVFQHVLHVLVALATTAFVFRLSGSRWRAGLTGGLLGIDLPMLEYANTVLTELFFTTLFVFVLWLLWKESEDPTISWTRSVLSGFLAGIGTLIRPVSMFFFLPAAVYLVLVRRKLRLRAALS